MAPFRDRPESAFFKSRHFSAEETFAAAEQKMLDGLSRIRATFFGRQLRMDHERLLRYHGSIFGGLFTELEGAGRYRTAQEPTVFAVPVKREGEWMTTSVSGAAHTEIRPALDEVFAAWDRRIRSMRHRRVPLGEGALAISELYTGILRVHPFVDGNHRSSFMVYAAASWSFRWPLIRFSTAKEMREHDRAVGAALLPDEHDPRPFAELVERRVREAGS